VHNNGQPNGRVHEHAHEHAYEYPHEHIHENMHEHSHERPHDVPEAATGADARKRSAAETLALLNYMAKHSFSHAGELDILAKRLRAEGAGAAAFETELAADLLRNASAKLEGAMLALSR